MQIKNKRKVYELNKYTQDILIRDSEKYPSIEHSVVKLKQCKGCSIGKNVCSLTNNFIGGCPCSQCITKIMCNSICETRSKYYIEMCISLRKRRKDDF